MDTVNTSLYAIPAAYLLAFVPHVINVSPRTTMDAVKGRMPAAAYEMAKRADAAHQNGLESFSPFAIAMVVGNLSPTLSPTTLTLAATSYLAARALYTLVYIANTTPAVAALRSSVWGISVASWMVVLYKVAAGAVLAVPAAK
ncbi:hypothetical protein PhCBS80983_g06248 [Powellomyces hirtus]|uniref:Uncharacterized protein n=1 Tax=Powellomyces hirtus TaxID=109895 RepID=A0A507DPM6_9FUNG|nr:hypothetical protein PhCBS80983_g06248 [Powellomyces hirtus]